MTGLFIFLIALASVLLILVVFIQNPKGGGLSSDFGSAQQIGGVQKTTDFIEKATWGLASFIAIASIFLTITLKSPDPSSKKEEKAKKEQKKNGNKTDSKNK